MKSGSPRAAKYFALFVTIFAASVATLLAANWYYLQYQPTRLADKQRSILDMGYPAKPYTVLFLGCDLPYTFVAPQVQQPDIKSVSGRSDTVMVVRVDPIRKSLLGLHIPRDTSAHIPGYGVQKINAANAIGGPALAEQTVSELLTVPIDHYVVLNVHGLVEAVNEIGGITVEVPKRMSYMDWTAKLKIDLEPGVHTLTGNQAMGFVRFRHDELGDIGRVQRQQIFMRAFMNKMLEPASWVHIPALLRIARANVSTDLSDVDILQGLNLARSLPRNSIQFALLPGHFGNQGGWVPDEVATRRVVNRIFAAGEEREDPAQLVVAVQNLSSEPAIEDRVCTILRHSGYSVVVMPPPRREIGAAEPSDRQTRIITQQASYAEAETLRRELGNKGEIVNASVGDLYSNITLLINDDLKPLLLQQASQSVPN
jgi:LCP family protein required for cell wall assembly